MTSQENKEFDALLELLTRTRGFDFTGYKTNTLERRVRKRMSDVAIRSFSDYADLLESQPAEFEALFNTMLINVTSFFRDPPAWQTLQELVIAPLADSQKELRIWSAGCSSGEETYTLVMLFAEALGTARFRQRVKVYATDADADALEQARIATYSAKRLANVSDELRTKYFEPATAGWAFHKDLRRSVIFGRHDLLNDPPISRIDLIVCRNTLIYFNAETQTRILARFNFGLKSNGYLFMGKSEMLLTQTRLFAPVDMDARIFRKVERADLRDRLLAGAAARRRDETAATQLLTEHQTHMREVSFESAPISQVILDNANHVVLVNQQARRNLSIDNRDIGRPVQDLELSYRPAEIRSRIDEAKTTGATVTIHDIEYARPGHEVAFLDIQIEPLIDAGGQSLGVSISFVDVTASHRLRLEVERAQHELETAYEEMQANNEELETTNEELQSSIEELETTNEELQSTNEELETMNEELQSTNEVLETTNEELQRRTDEVRSLNELMHNIMNGIPNGVAVTDTDLRVQVWNERAEDCWGLRANEVIGKTITDIIAAPHDGMGDALRAFLSGRSDFAAIEVEAANRRGRRTKLLLTCDRLGSAKEPRGLVLMMEEVE